MPKEPVFHKKSFFLVVVCNRELDRFSRKQKKKKKKKKKKKNTELHSTTALCILP
jgi:hypothetical protein